MKLNRSCSERSHFSVHNEFEKNHSLASSDSSKCCDIVNRWKRLS